MTHLNDADDIARAMVENSELIRELDEACSEPMQFWPPRRVDPPQPTDHMDAGDGLSLADVLMVVVLIVFSVLAYLGQL